MIWRCRCGTRADLAILVLMRCPICKKPADPSRANRFRPFCSERCQMTDLGTWANESYRVAGKSVEETEHPDDDLNAEDLKNKRNLN